MSVSCLGLTSCTSRAQGYYTDNLPASPAKSDKKVKKSCFLGKKALFYDHLAVSGEGLTSSSPGV